MYIDCDSDYFPVKFLEGVSAKYSHSPRVIRNGDDVRSVQVHRSAEEIKQLLRATYAWAPDFRVTMKSLIVADDCAATEWLSEGTQTGPIGDNLPASGNSFRLRGASILTFRDGKIASVTDYYDMATFLTQLGGTT